MSTLLSAPSSGIVHENISCTFHVKHVSLKVALLLMAGLAPVKLVVQITCLVFYTFIPCCLQFKTYKIVYRRYAGLFFSVGIDVSDNELAALEAIHLFVEILDHYFSNVCELDLVFNFHKVCLALHTKQTALESASAAMKHYCATVFKKQS
jgi:hypothetical protein